MRHIDEIVSERFIQRLGRCVDVTGEFAGRYAAAADRYCVGREAHGGVGGILCGERRGKKAGKEGKALWWLEQGEGRTNLSTTGMRLIDR